MSASSTSTQNRFLERLRLYGLLIRLDRPIGTLLLLWPTLWALWIAGEGRPDPVVFSFFVTGVFLMRSAGCAINDYADRRIDPHVSRTRNRPLAAGQLHAGEALAVFAVLILLAFVLVLQTNRLTLQLAFGGASLAALYPFMKRWTALPQYVLGVAFAWAVPMAFAAQTGTVPGLAWVLFASVVLWTAAFDTLYAMVDREDDLKIGVRSTAILFAGWDRVAIAVMQILALAGLLLAGRMAGLGYWYGLGLAGAALSVMYQQWLIVDRDPARCFQAFLTNNSLGALVFAGIALHYTFI